MIAALEHPALDPHLEHVRKTIGARHLEATVRILDGQRAALQTLVRDAGADVLTLGNHVWAREAVAGYLDTSDRVIRPANLASGLPGRGLAVAPATDGTPTGRVYVAMSNGAGTTAGLGEFFHGTVQSWFADFRLPQPLSVDTVGKAPGDAYTRRYYRRLNRYSANLALVADTSMLLLGGKLELATQEARRARDMARNSGGWPRVGEATELLASIELVRGELSDARRHAARAVELAEQHGRDALLVNALLVLAEASAPELRPELFERARVAGEALANPYRELDVSLTSLRLGLGDPLHAGDDYVALEQLSDRAEALSAQRHVGLCLLAQAEVLGRMYPMLEGDRYFSVLPTNHAIDFMCGFLIPFMMGGAVVHQRTLRPAYLGATMERYGITHIALVPTIVIGLVFMWRDGLRPADVKNMASFAGSPGRPRGER